MDISGFDEYIVKQINIYDEYDQHSKCIVELSVENDQIQDFLSNNAVGSKDICVSLEGEILFYGCIRNIKCTNTYLKTNVRVEALSFSSIIDSEIHNRVFQNSNKTFNQINDFFSDKKITINCIEEGLGDEKIPGILVQNNETDFEFLRRLYNKKGVHLIVDATKKTSCLLKIGEKKESSVNSLETVDILKLERVIYEGREEINLITSSVFDVGTELEVQGNRYYIISRNIESRYEKTEINYRGIYKGKVFEDVMKEKSYLLGLAKVTDNGSEDNLGKIQVEFIDYDNEMSDDKIWIDYISPLTEKKGGFVTVPDIDEVVEIIMRNEECVAIGCVRTCELDGNIQDISKRYLVSRGCNLTIDEKNICMEVDKNKINITDELIDIANEKFEIVIKDEQCKIGFEDSRIVIEMNRIQSVGKNDIEVKAKNIKFEGNSKVEVKTKSFDVG